MAVVDETATKLHVLLTFDNMQNPLPLPHKPTSERPKVLQASQFFTRLTSKCASHHNAYTASLKTKLFCETSSGFELDNIKNAAIQRDFLNFCTWQHQKRNKSARLPHFSKLTTSKTKQFCEPSFKNGKTFGKLSAELAASYQCVLRFFHSTCLKYCACH